MGYLISTSMGRIDKAKSFLSFSELYSDLMGFFSRLDSLIEMESCYDLYLGCRRCSIVFFSPSPLCEELELISLAVMRLLVRYILDMDYRFARFTIIYTIQSPNMGDFSFTIGNSIVLKDSSGKALPMRDLYHSIIELVKHMAEKYEGMELKGIALKVFYSGLTSIEKVHPLSDKEVFTRISYEIKKEIGHSNVDRPVSKLVAEKRAVTADRSYIPSLKRVSMEMRAFIVADLETVVVDGCHVPYAGGFLVVNPGDRLEDKRDVDIDRYFSEDHKFFISDFEKRSCRMLSQFLERLESVCRQREIRTVYFHNFGRFDGIILMRYFSSCLDKYTFTPLFRNSMLYELRIYKNKKLLYRLRDSLCILPKSLNELARTFCPDLGLKGELDHSKLTVLNLSQHREEIMSYLAQDIRLLGAVMLKAQALFFNDYKVDIENVMTLAALAMRIFRINFYDVESAKIYIPNRNEDRFIRAGYYGGHSDAYIPQGENLYYYDVNSLYPYIMKSYEMPSGKPIWHSSLVEKPLEELYGFIEAYVVCPNSIKRPFLPYRDSGDTLLFPTGEFVGVYFSEELKYARSIGYEIYPLRGYLFKSKSKPFESFVENLFSKRQEAKAIGDGALDYGYKIIMNSLYGRFGINPVSVKTEVCKRERYDFLIENQPNVIDGNRINDDYYYISYKMNTLNVKDKDWQAPRQSAVQISAAITAYSRIHMYKYICRSDCYYTDTDSAILGSMLPEDEVSPIELGKLKLENKVKEGIFLAPKSYSMLDVDGKVITKHKGAGKGWVNQKHDWFRAQLAEPSREEKIAVKNAFKRDIPNLRILSEIKSHTLGVKIDNKRNPIYDKNKKWVSTEPYHVEDLGGQELVILQIKLDTKEKLNATINELYQREKQENAAKDETISHYQEKISRDKERMSHLENEVSKLQQVIEKKGMNRPSPEAMNRTSHEGMNRTKHEAMNRPSPEAMNRPSPEGKLLINKPKKKKGKGKGNLITKTKTKKQKRKGKKPP